MAFFLRSQRLLDGRKPARLDHQLLQATLAAGHATASASASRCAGGQSEDPLIELVTGGADWRRAATQLRGCFNRVEAGRGGNGA